MTSPQPSGTSFAVRLTFGRKSSPKIFDILSEALCWILANNYNIPYLIHLLDDFLIVSPNHASPATHLTTTQKLLSKLGIPIASEKTEGPATSLEFLGIKLDSEKVERIISVILNITSAQQISKRELLFLLGHLNFTMRIVPQGRPFISHLLSLATSVPGLNDPITLNSASRTKSKSLALNF